MKGARVCAALGVCLGGALAGCDAKAPPAAEAGAAPVAAESASVEPAKAGQDPLRAMEVARAAHMAPWSVARNAAMRVPCRAIAVDGPVHAEAGDAGAPDPEAGATVTGSLALQGEVPSDVWIALAPDARLVAKDPRTTRETSFLGPARVQACVGHREESWLDAGRFESSVGAGETPGAEEWVVTPLGIVRYLAAKVAVEVRPRETAVALGSGVAFLWLPDDVRFAAPRSRDASALPALDDDAWDRMAEGEVTLQPTATRPPVDAARSAVDRCSALGARARDLAAKLLAGHPETPPEGDGPAVADGGSAGAAKEQMKTRRLARAACSVAQLRVAALPPSAPKAEMSARLESGGEPNLAGAARPAPPAAP